MATTPIAHPEDLRRAAVDRALAVICPGRLPTLRELNRAIEQAGELLAAGAER